MFGELANLSLRNLMRARARLAMTSGGVVVGTASVILLIALTLGLQAAAEKGFGSNQSLTLIDVFPNYSPDGQQDEMPQLTVGAVQEFWRIPNVSAVVPTVYVGTEVRSDKYVGYPGVIGIDPAILPYLPLTAERGELRLEPGTAIVGKYAGEYWNDPTYTGEEWQPVSVDLLETDIYLNLMRYSTDPPTTRRIDFEVTGQFAEGTAYDYAIIMPIEDVLDYRMWMEEHEFDPKTFVFDQVTVYANDRENTRAVSDAIRDMGYMAGGPGDFLEQINGFFRTMRLMLGSVGGVALLVAAFGVANTMTMAILERTKEIGLMKAVGATDEDVLTIFLLEAGLVGLVGGASGVGLSYFLQRLINRAVENIPAGEGGVTFLPVDLSQVDGNLIIIPSELALFAIVLATLVGLGAGFFPALRAARLEPVLALKSE